MYLTEEELRELGVRPEAITVYLKSDRKLECSQRVLATLHLLNAIDRPTYERRLKELHDMSSEAAAAGNQ